MLQNSVEFALNTGSSEKHSNNKMQPDTLLFETDQFKELLKGVDYVSSYQKGRVHIVFGTDPVGVSVGISFRVNVGVKLLVCSVT